MKTFYEEDKVIINAKKAYQFLINRYKTPLDIPKNAWMQGKDMEVGKWYLWTDGGSEEKGPTHLQYIIMIPELFNNKVQTVNNFDALWYLTSPVSKLYYPLTKKKSLFAEELKVLLQWYSKEYLDITLESFGLAENEFWVLGPLQHLPKPFMNWGDYNPWEVKE